MGVTVVITGELVLFVGFGSLAGLPPLAMFVKLTPLTGAVTVTVRFVAAPAASEPRFVQTIWLPLVVAPTVALTKLTADGRLSVTDKLAAVPGPRFVTVMV